MGTVQPSPPIRLAKVNSGMYAKVNVAPLNTCRVVVSAKVNTGISKGKCCYSP